MSRLLDKLNIEEDGTQKKIFYFSLLLTFFSIIVNSSTYFLNIYYKEYSFLFIIHGLIFIPIIIMAIHRKNELKNISDKKSKNPYLNMLRMAIPNGNSIAYIIFILCFLYVFVNFFIVLQNIKDGMAEIIDGKYVLNNKGIITEITENIYYKRKFLEMRLFSGHWIIFSVFPTFYYYFNGGIKKNKNKV